MLNFLFRLFISFIPVIPLYFLANRFLLDDIKIFWFLAYYYLVSALLVNPIFRIFLKFKKLKKYLGKIVIYRRSIWILAWIFSILHLIHFEEGVRLLWIRYYTEKTNYINFFINEISLLWKGSVIGINFYAFWFWLVSFIIMMFLFISSNNLSQKIMWKFWKYLQKLVYPLFILVIIHIYFIWWWKWVYLYPAVVLISLRLYVWLD